MQKRFPTCIASHLGDVFPPTHTQFDTGRFERACCGISVGYDRKLVLHAVAGMTWGALRQVRCRKAIRAIRQAPVSID